MAKDYHKGKRITVYIPEEMHKVIKEYCDKSGETITSITIESLEHFINVVINQFG